MVKVIRITTEGDFRNALVVLNRIKRRLPQMTREAIRKFGGVLVRDMKVSARRARIRRSLGVLQTTGIRWDQGKKSDIGMLFIRLYGIYLDSMRPHYVNITRGRSRLLAWAKMSRSSRIRSKARKIESGELKKFSIYVKPHPFILRGYRTARPKLRSILKSKVNRAVNL